MTRRGWLAGLGMGTGAVVTAACGGQSGGDVGQSGGPIKPEPGTLLWLYWSNPPDRKVLHDQIVAKFQAENPNVKVDGVDPPSGGAAGYVTKVAVMTSAGEKLDVFGLSPVWVPDNVDAKLAHDLNSYAARDKAFKVDDYAKGVIDAGSWKGKLYFLAVFANFNLLYYNKTLLDRAGVKYPDDTWTKEMVLDAARKLTGADGATKVWGFNFSRDLNNISPYIWNNGGDAFDKPEDPTKATMSSAASLEALQWLVDLINKHKVAPGEGGAPQPTFQSGQVAMQTMPVGNLGQVARDAQFPWDVTFIPKGKTGKRENYAGTLFYGVSVTSKLPDSAWSLLKTICGSYGVGLHVQAQIGAPSIKGLEKDYLAMPPPANRKVVLDTLPLLRALPKVRGMNDIYEPAFTTNLNRAYAGEITATDAARLIDEKATPLIKKS
ncbi:MAG TPA: sugar ABC transporter substrate-binding protein [Chloroflexota bacterium]|nr:sugar ABC transporter substrate-binding protein [Chloroflexota bacterium]